MKAFHKTALAAAVTVFALSTAVAEANPLGFTHSRIDYGNSFNTDTKTDIDVDNSKRLRKDTRLNYNLDNSVRTKVNNDYRLKFNYDYRKDDINAKQNLNQIRSYKSAVNQRAFNSGSASGHAMTQNQGGTSVGSLVSETTTSKHKGHTLLSPTRSFASGNVAKGNMNQSHIGGIQSGMQVGDVANIQGNTQNQRAVSGVTSSDSVSNSASKK